MSKRIVTFIVAVSAISLVMGLVGIFKRPPVDPLEDQVSFATLYEDLILSADVYDLSDQELASKYSDQKVRVEALPESDIRYFLLTDESTKTHRLAVRGTSNLRNAVVDAQYSKWVDGTLDVYLHRGFQNAAAEVLRDVEPFLRRDFNIVVTGHSLGGAVAAILMMHLDHRGFIVDRTTTFGQPKVTNVDGASRFSESKLLRVINLEDIVSKVPPRSLLGNINQPYQHFAPEVVMMKDDRYAYQKPRLPNPDDAQAAADELQREATRGLWEDYLDAHRIVNYTSRLQRLMTLGQRVPKAEPPLTAPSDKAPSGRPTQKYALLVGIDDYQHGGVPDLRGCVNDVHAMKNLLVGTFGFPAQNVRVLTNAAATRAGVLRAVRDNLVAPTADGDIAVFHFSGHGSQMRDVSGDESDQWDETIVAYDSRSEGVLDISDDDLNALFKELDVKTNLTVILDSCHSGTATRAINVRGIERDQRQPDESVSLAASSSRTTAAGHDVKDSREDNGLQDGYGYAMIAAAQANELAREHSHRGVVHGALTHFFVSEARRGGVEQTYRDVLDRVQLALSGLYPDQHPQLEGGGADKRLFDVTDAPVAPYITVSLLADGTPVLLAGAAQGMTKGSTFNVFPPTTKDFTDDSRASAEIELTEVRSLTSKAKVIRGGEISYASRAVERRHAFGEFTFNIYFAGDSEIERELQQRFAEYPHLTVVDSSSLAQVRIQRQGEVLTLVASFFEEPRSFPATTESLEKIVLWVLHWAKWFNLYTLDHPASTLKVGLSVGKQSDSKTAGIGESEVENSRSQSFDAGQRVSITVDNRSDANLYFAVIDLETTGDVSILYPTDGSTATILAGNSWTGAFRFTLPEGRRETRDYLKLIATRHPINVSFMKLELPPSLRGSDPLQAMLTNAAFGSRKAELISVDADDWATATVRCIVRSRE
ncbi:caspase family protein [Rhodopirellula sp. JC639]|uniref:caspase family protein n=1 Tax=Stieleria mannarensis TaxID=2755585 RepID=UPI0016049B4D|nr:caspase family protein [Rhodopirellula sp. JC639]